MAERRIPYTKPSITEREVAYCTDAASNGWGERCYEYVARFEALFQAHLGVRHAIATSSCTGALHMGLHALGVGPGDEVILADVNWIATAAPIVHLGATPVLVDILPDTWCLDPARVAAAITPRTKAIIAVHLYGNLCDLNALLELGERHNIPVVEDAAEAIGSVYHGRCAGSLGRFGVFSFHGTKTVTTGEGGMFVTNDSELYERVLTLSNHGRQRGQVRQFWPDAVGFKYKMSNVSAAIGCAQLERIDDLVARKQEIFRAYRKLLSGLPLVLNPPDTPGLTHGYWMPAAVVVGIPEFERQALLRCFEASHIDGRVFFWPLSWTGHFQVRHDIPVSRAISPYGVNLPTYHDMTQEDIDRVVAVLTNFLNQ